MDASSIVWLILGALILSALAVVLDRVNFPQRPFRAKQIVTDGPSAARDRTGAHIVDDEDGDDEDEDEDEALDDGEGSDDSGPWEGAGA
jgi:hypothetical protein